MNNDININQNRFRYSSAERKFKCRQCHQIMDKELKFDHLLSHQLDEEEKRRNRRNNDFSSENMLNRHHRNRINNNNIYLFMKQLNAFF